MTVSGTEVQTTLKGLNPKTNYAIKVQAISERGPGVVSDPVKSLDMSLFEFIVGESQNPSDNSNGSSRNKGRCPRKQRKYILLRRHR